MVNSKILIVDDEVNICELIRLYVEKEGYKAITAHDGQKAIDLFYVEQPDLILLDVMLPVNSVEHLEQLSIFRLLC